MKNSHLRVLTVFICLNQKRFCICKLPILLFSKPTKRVPLSQTSLSRKLQEKDEDTSEKRNSENSSTTLSFTNSNPMRNGSGKTYFETGRKKVNFASVNIERYKRSIGFTEI